MELACVRQGAYRRNARCLYTSAIAVGLSTPLLVLVLVFGLLLPFMVTLLDKNKTWRRVLGWVLLGGCAARP
jgi:hypothetical protein